MLGATLTLSTDPPTNVNTNTEVFALRAADLGRSEYSVAGLTLPTKRLLTVSHEVGKNGEERHLTRVDRTSVDALLVPATVSAYLVIVRPNSTAATANEVKGAVYELFDAVLTATVDALLNNEV